MLDMKWLRKDPKAVEAKLKTKDPSIDLSSIMELDEKTREILVKVESLKAERNQPLETDRRKKTSQRRHRGTHAASRRHWRSVTALDHELAASRKRALAIGPPLCPTFRWMGARSLPIRKTMCALRRG